MSDEHYKVPPPGIPFGYELVVIHQSCANCGSHMIQSRVEEIARAGYGTKKLALRGGDRMFDRPVMRTERHFSTPACIECIDRVPLLPVRYPVPGAVVGRSARMAEEAGAARSREKVPATIRMEEITDDFA